MYNKRIFKACEARETAVYFGVNEDFESERNAENTLLDNFYFWYTLTQSTCISQGRTE